MTRRPGPLFEVADAVLRTERSAWSPSERLVALAVADCMGPNGQAYPSVSLLATRTALGRRTVQRALARLTGLGGLFREDTGGSTADGGRRASIYTLAPSAMMAQVPAPHRRGSDPRHGGTGATDDTNPRHGGAPRDQEETNTSAPALRAVAVAARAVRKGHNGNGNGKVTSAAQWVTEACDDWNARFGPGSAQGGRIGGGLRPVVRANCWAVIRPAWKRYLRETGHPSPSAQDFAAHWSDWKASDMPPAQEPESRGPEFFGERQLA